MFSNTCLFRISENMGGKLAKFDLPHECAVSF